MEKRDKIKTIKASAFAVVRAKHCKDGIELFFQSPYLEEYFKGIAFGENRESWLGLKGRKINMMNFSAAGRSIIVQEWATLALYENERFNFSILRAIGLADGISIKLNQPMSDEMFDKMILEIKQGMAGIYKQIVGGNREVEIYFSAKEVQR